MEVQEVSYRDDVNAKMQGISENIKELERLNGYIDRLGPELKNEKVYYFDYPQFQQQGTDANSQIPANEDRISVSSID